MVLAGLVLLAAHPAIAGDSISPVQSLLAELNSVGLEPARVYEVREASLHREDLHLTLEDGTIAFTRAVNGRITGAVWEGHGEVLVMPPNTVERRSMGLFTGAAILEEKINTAYLRFNDDTFAELAPALRPPENAPLFISTWGARAPGLAQMDGLRLLASFLNADPRDRWFHARVRGERLGNFDLTYDTTAPEPIMVGQSRSVNGVDYYDVWSSFPSRSLRAGKAGPPAGVRITNYGIRAYVKPPRELRVELDLTLNIQQPGQRLVFFQLSRFLEVSQAKYKGTNLEVIRNPAREGTAITRRENDLIALVFPAALEPGSAATIQLAYSGPAISDAGEFAYVGGRGDWLPYRAATQASFDAEFRYPAEWTLVAGGKRVASHSDAGEQVSRWISEGAVAGAGFTLGRFSHAAAKAGEVAITSYAFSAAPAAYQTAQGMIVANPGALSETRVLVNPPFSARDAGLVAQSAAHAVDLLSRRLGPFPFSSFSLAEIPEDRSFSWPTLALVGRGASLAQEAARQWWAGPLTWKSDRDQWLVEALANYCALATLEAEHPNEFRRTMDHYRQQLPPVAEAGAVSQGPRLSSSKFPGAYEVLAQARGTWLVHMLRHLLLDSKPSKAVRPRRTSTDDPFFQVLRAILERHREGEISTADLKRAFEQALPEPAQFQKRKSLDWFFEQWVDGTALPRLELADVNISRKPGAVVATGKILQKEAPEHLITSIPLYAAGTGKPVLLGRIFAEGAETEFRFTVPPDTKKLLLDPYQTVLTRPN
jgi:hypothetical protein